MNENHMKAVAEDKPLVVRISEQKETRSLAQNRLYWLWLDTFAKEMGDSSDYYHVFLSVGFYQRFIIVMMSFGRKRWTWYEINSVNSANSNMSCMR